MSATLDITAVLLVGGMGTRLRSIVPSVPKPLAPIGDQSFLELLVKQVRYQGIRRIVMCSGYLADQVHSKFGDGSSWHLSIEYSQEAEPLGTAGALKLARRHLQGLPDFLVMNGDSFLDADLVRLVRFQRERRGLASMAVVSVQNAGRYGSVRVGPGNKVVGFTEKNGADAPGLINAGVYAFDAAILNYIPEGPVSLEREVFPRVLDRGIYALEERGMFIDIGTPQDYARALLLWEQITNAAVRR